MKHNTPVDVYVPTDFARGVHRITNIRPIAPGSGIVSNSDVRGDYLQIYFEGNLYGAQNIVTYADRISHAHGRMIQRYPTIANALVFPDAMTKVGTYMPTTGVLLLLDDASGWTRDLVMRWCSLTEDQIEEQLLTTNYTHTLARAEVTR